MLQSPSSWAQAKPKALLPRPLIGQHLRRYTPTLLKIWRSHGICSSPAQKLLITLRPSSANCPKNSLSIQPPSTWSEPVIIGRPLGSRLLTQRLHVRLGRWREGRLWTLIVSDCGPRPILEPAEKGLDHAWQCIAGQCHKRRLRRLYQRSSYLMAVFPCFRSGYRCISPSLSTFL